MWSKVWNVADSNYPQVELPNKEKKATRTENEDQGLSCLSVYAHPN